MHIKKKIDIIVNLISEKISHQYTFSPSRMENLFQSTLTNTDALNYIFSSYLIMFLFSLLMN